MSRPTDPLQERGNAPRRAELSDEINVANVDTQLQRCGRDQGLELPGLEPLFGAEAGLLGEATVMGGDRLLAQALRQVSGNALRKTARVHEYERGLVRLDQLGEPIIDLAPHLARHDGLEG